jgi:hypothetical protein
VKDLRRRSAGRGLASRTGEEMQSSSTLSTERSSSRSCVSSDSVSCWQHVCSCLRTTDAAHVVFFLMVVVPRHRSSSSSSSSYHHIPTSHHIPHCALCPTPHPPKKKKCCPSLHSTCTAEAAQQKFLSSGT